MPDDGRISRNCSHITDAMVESALEAANGAKVDSRRYWTDGDREAVRAMLAAVFPKTDDVKAAPRWFTSWPYWHGIEGNTEVVPSTDYDVLMMLYLELVASNARQRASAASETAPSGAAYEQAIRESIGRIFSQHAANLIVKRAKEIADAAER